MSDPEIGKSVVAAGLKTNFLEDGSGPPVLLLHGSGPGVTAYANWRLTIPALAVHFRVLAPDVAGFGYTERKPDTQYTLDFWVAHIIGFLDALGIDRVFVVGNSFGGALSLSLATRYPERITRIALMGSTGLEFELTEGLDAVWGYEPSPENMAKLMGYFCHDVSLATADLIKSRFNASVRPGFHETYARLFPAPRQRGIKAISTPVASIRALEQRALIIHGRDDKVIPVSTSWELSRLIKRSELHVFGECGHWTQIEKRERFNSVLVDFLKSP